MVNVLFEVWTIGLDSVFEMRLKMFCSSCLALGPRALRDVLRGRGVSSGLVTPLVRIWRTASSSSSFHKAAQQLSPAVGDFSVDFSCRTLSSLLKLRRLTAAYYFIQALALPWLVCSRISANIVE